MTLSTLTDQIWLAVQRPSPSVTREEINEIVSLWYDKLGAVDNIADDNERLRSIAIRSINKYYDRQREVRAAAPPKTPEHALVHQYFEGFGVQRAFLAEEMPANALNAFADAKIPWRYAYLDELMGDIDD